jgi:hypothetical protein
LGFDEVIDLSAGKLGEGVRRMKLTPDGSLANHNELGILEKSQPMLDPIGG